jgi:hypothetical protein
MSAPAARELCAGISAPGVQALLLGERAQNPSMCRSAGWKLSKTKTGIVVAVKQREAEPVQSTAAALTPQPPLAPATPASPAPAVPAR